MMTKCRIREHVDYEKMNIYVGIDKYFLIDNDIDM